MKLIKSKVEILDKIDGQAILERIEQIARTCYKSEDKITKDSAQKLAKRLIESKHEAMLEFVDVTVKFTTDRGVSHELVRHRLASFAQESTRYCNYSKDKFGKELTFIIPSWVKTISPPIETLEGPLSADVEWCNQMYKAEQSYFELLKRGWKPQQARMVLPMSIKTEINMKCNLREWRHFFKLRCSVEAHPDIRKLALDLLNQMHEQIPIIFDDLYEEFLNK